MTSVYLASPDPILEDIDKLSYSQSWTKQIKLKRSVNNAKKYSLKQEKTNNIKEDVKTQLFLRKGQTSQSWNVGENVGFFYNAVKLRKTSKTQLKYHLPGRGGFCLTSCQKVKIDTNASVGGYALKGLLTAWTRSILWLLAYLAVATSQCS